MSNTKGTIQVNSDRCECAGCGEVFKNDAAFVCHRMGPADKRFCADPVGLRRLVKNVNDLWRTK